MHGQFTSVGQGGEGREVFRVGADPHVVAALRGSLRISDGCESFRPFKETQRHIHRVRADEVECRPANAARFTFLAPAAAEFYPDWDAVADQNVATLRTEVGRNPYDKALSDLIGELSTRGDTFRQRWAQHEVRRHRAGSKRLNHPLAGQLTFNYETMELAADEGLYLIVCGVAPGSRDAEALNLLASWSASASARTTSKN